jgi:archaellum component FlaG (FlaF/FlaG flagellin family)
MSDRPYFYKIVLSFMLFTVCFSLFVISPVKARESKFTDQGSVPLYYNSYDWQNTNNSYLPEDRMKTTIDWFAENFLPYGYEYFTHDGWSGNGTRHTANGYVTTHNDNWVHDWGYWADYAHSKGLKFGVYYAPFWLLKSIADGPVLYVEGTDYTLKSITSNQAFQNRYLIDPDKPGAENYVKGFIHFLKGQGVDFIKVDFLHDYENRMGSAKLEKILKWLDEASGDDMFLSFSAPHNKNHAAVEKQYGDMIRISQDIYKGGWGPFSSDNRGKPKGSWPEWGNAFDALIDYSDLSGKGKVILDPDFVTASSFSTDAEAMTAVSLFSIAGAGLGISDSYDKLAERAYVFQNTELLDLYQQGFVGKPLVRDVNNPLSQIWKGQLPDGTWVVGFFNREDTAQIRSVDFATDLGLKGDYIVSDMLSHSTIGVMSSYTENIAPHGNAMIKISKLTVEPYGGSFMGSQQVTLNALDSQAEIRYTLDGSTPTSESQLYTGSFVVNQSTNLRAKVMNGDGQGYEARAKFMKAETDPITDIAARMTSIIAPAKGTTHLTLPKVPSGYTVSIKSSDHPEVIKSDGTIIWPDSDTTVKLILEVKRTSDGMTRETASISLVVQGSRVSYLYETESLPFTLNPGNLATKMNSEGNASGGKNIQITFTEDKDQSVEFTANVPAAGFYEVIYGYKKNNNRGIIQANVDGAPLGSPIDHYIHTNQAGYFAASLGNVHFTTAGYHKFKFEIVGKNPLYNKTLDFVIDYIKLVSLAENPTITEVTPVHIIIQVGIAPSLPPYVTTVYTDNSTQEAPVTWDPISPHQYASAGSFTVQGTVTGTSIKALAHITATPLPLPATSAFIEGINEVNVGASFDLTYGLAGVNESVYAQDLTFTYDPAKVDFVEAESMKNGFEIVGMKQSPGLIRLAAVGIGDDASRSGGDLLKLTWKSKPMTESSATTISLSNAFIAIGDGTEKQIEGVSHAVTILVRVGNPGDVNDDGKVSIGDLAIVARHYGKSSGDSEWDLYKFADLNHDGRIDIEDLAIVARKLIETPLSL